MQFSTILLAGTSLLLTTALPTTLSPRACTIEQPTLSPDAGKFSVSVGKDTTAQFNVPAGSWGCQLEFFFPAGFNKLQLSGHTQQVNVYTKNDQNQEFLFGTTTFTAGVVQQDTRIFVNSATCAPNLNYTFRLVGDGSVFFEQGAAQLRLSHNC